MTYPIPAVQSLAPATGIEGNSNSLQKLGFLAVCTYVFFYLSRVLDMTLSFLHLPLILSYVAAFAMLVSGNLLSAAKTRVGGLYLVLTALFFLGLPFAVWRTGTLLTLLGPSFVGGAGWARTMFIWAFIVGLTTTYDESKSLLNACAIGIVGAAAVAFAVGTNDTGERLGITGGKFNPNELALILIFGVPLLWRIYHSGGRPGKLRKVLVSSAILFVVAQFSRTGSRGGLLAAGVGLLLTIRLVPFVKKLQIVAATLLLTLLGAVFLPQSLILRYRTLVADTDEETTAVERSAEASTESRKRLLMQSIEVALTHPLLGVGLNNFPVYISDMNKQAGRPKEGWFGTHNSYTQMASEAGIPALIVFLALLITSWRALGRLIEATRNDTRPGAVDIYSTACAMQIALGIFCCFIFFDHMAYDPTPHMIVAFCVVISRGARAELERLGPPPREAPPVALPMGPARMSRRLPAAV